MFKLIHKAKKNQKGFTLVELMVVVVIIGVLVAIAIPVYQNVVGNANRNTVEANLRTIDGAVAMFQAANASNPDNIDDLVPNYIQAVPEGPDGTTYALTSPTATATVPASRAVASPSIITPAWWTADTSVSLPVNWTPAPATGTN